MKDNNIILDNPFKEDIPLVLSKGEKVLWEGSSIYHKEFGRKKFYRNLPLFFRKKIEYRLKATILYFYFIIFVAFLSKALTISIFLAILATMIILTVLLSFPDLYFSYKRINTTAYILTSKQLIFKLGEKRNKQVHSVPLNQIRDITFQRNTDQPECGFIVFQLDKNYSPSFDTVDLFTGEKHKKLNLTMIENVGEVFTLLKSTISKSKKDEY